MVFLDLAILISESVGVREQWMIREDVMNENRSPPPSNLFRLCCD